MRHLVLLSIFGTACTGMIDSDGPGTGPSDTEVQIVIRDGHSPRVGVLVIFQDERGALVTDARTDAAGAAAAELPDGGSVTVIRTYSTPLGEEPIPAEVYTYVGVKAGDRLALGKPTSVEGPASAVLVEVPEAATGTVKIVAPCGAGQGTGPLVAITVRDCDPEIGLYVVDGNQQSFFARAAFSENMDLSRELLVDSLGSTISATNVPPNTTVTVEQRLGSRGFDFYTTGAKRVDQAPADVTLPPLSGVEHLVLVSSSGNNRTQLVATRKPYAQDTISVDASAGLIASVSEVKRTPDAITWVEEGAGAPDAVLASLAVTRPDTTTLDRQYVRVIIAPHGGPSLQVPILPAAGAIYNPAEGDQVGTRLGLVKATGGYDAVRARAFAVPSLVDAAPLDGQITLSYTGSRPGL